MSTRANIIFQDGRNSIQIYKHAEGYPSAVTLDLRNAMTVAWKLPRYEADDFSAAYVLSTKSRGGDVYIDGTADGFKKVHGDIGWCYVVRPGEGLLHRKPQVEIYRAQDGFDKPPYKVIELGKVLKNEE